MLHAEGALLRRQRVGRLQAQLQVAIARLVPCERLQLDQQRGHEVERDLHARELPEQRDHPPVILERVQAHPGQDVLPGEEVLIEGLVHVPQDGDAGHGGYYVGIRGRGECLAPVVTAPCALSTAT